MGAAEGNGTGRMHGGRAAAATFIIAPCSTGAMQEAAAKRHVIFLGCCSGQQQRTHTLLSTPGHHNARADSPEITGAAASKTDKLLHATRLLHSNNHFRWGCACKSHSNGSYVHFLIVLSWHVKKVFILNVSAMHFTCSIKTKFHFCYKSSNVLSQVRKLANASLQAQDPERDCINDLINLQKKTPKGMV
jgi:hypothetical protein